MTPQRIIIGKGSQQTLVIQTLEDTEYVLEEGAQLTFVFLGNQGFSGKKLVKFLFQGSNSSVKFFGFILGKHQDEFIFETVSEHIAPQTQAHYYVKAVMYDESAVDYKGNLNILPAAQLADTYLAHHTLLMSPTARARTIPALEIEADDVKAGHAATVGKTDEDLMFYLQSRGLPALEAQGLLVSGFFMDQMLMIPDEAVRTTVIDWLVKELADKLNIREMLEAIELEAPMEAL